MQNFKSNIINHKAKKQSSGDGWLVSFADLLSLMLAFFVLQYSMSDIPDKKWQAISSSLSSYVRGIKVEIKKEDLAHSFQAFDKDKLKKTYDRQYLEKLINQSLEGFSDDYLLQSLKGEIALTIEVDKIYDGGLNDKGKEILLALSKTFQNFSNQIELKVTGGDKKNIIDFSNFISGKILQLGYEYRIYRHINFDNNINETEEKLLQIIIKDNNALYF